MKTKIYLKRNKLSKSCFIATDIIGNCIYESSFNDIDKITFKTEFSRLWKIWKKCGCEFRQNVTNSDALYTFTFDL